MCVRNFNDGRPNTLTLVCVQLGRSLLSGRTWAFGQEEVMAAGSCTSMHFRLYELMPAVDRMITYIAMQQTDSGYAPRPPSATLYSIAAIHDDEPTDRYYTQ